MTGYRLVVSRLFAGAALVICCQTFGLHGQGDLRHSLIRRRARLPCRISGGLGRRRQATQSGSERPCPTFGWACLLARSARPKECPDLTYRAIFPEPSSRPRLTDGSKKSRGTRRGPVAFRGGEIATVEAWKPLQTSEAAYEAKAAPDFSPPRKFLKKGGFARLLAEFPAPAAMGHHAKTSAAMIAGICGPKPTAPDGSAAAVDRNALCCAVPRGGGRVLPEFRLVGRKEADTHRGDPSEATSTSAAAKGGMRRGERGLDI